MAAWTRGVHHVGLTVPDVAAARRFFVDQLGFEEVGGKPDYPACFVSDGVVMLTLWQAVDPSSATPFDRKRCIGLHHLALRVDDLDAAHEHLANAEGVTVDFAPEPLGGGAARHMMCLIPGDIRLELIAP